MTTASKFKRTNEPRVEKILAMLATIYKSAKSNKTPDDEVSSLLSPVVEKINPPKPQAKTSSSPPSSNFSNLTTTPINRELSKLSDLSTQQLVDRMIACGAELANRRK